MIPKIIHQTWRDHDLPADFQHWSAAWRALHPTWEYRFYTDADIDRIIDERAPDYRATFDALPRIIQRVDMFRYLIVWLDGGLYADLDMIPFLPSDPLIEGEECVLSVEHNFRPVRQKELKIKRGFQMQNCIFAARPRHPFMGELLRRIGEIAGTPVATDNDVEDTTGPRMLSRLAFELPPERLGTIKVVPEIVWSAPWQYPRVWPLKSRIFARHASNGTWREDARPFKVRWRNRSPLPNPFERVGPTLP